jgi:hemolysin-activating ACP:hemolysin acyltransferase
VPVGAVLWACVSPQIADRLAAHAGENIQLDPHEWKSGEIVWVVASVGEGRVLGEMLKQLSKREWAGRVVKIVVRPKDGKPAVATFATAS